MAVASPPRVRARVLVFIARARRPRAATRARATTTREPDAADAWPVSRRAALIAAVSVAHARVARADVTETSVATASTPRTLVVGDGGAYASVGAALADARAGDEVRVRPGAYDERVIVDVDDVRIIGDASESGAPAVRISHVTMTPYESAIEVRGRGVVIRNVDVSHRSKSVADNYGVFAVEGSRVMFDGVRVTSSTGSGFGCEGAKVVMVGCEASACATHGVAAYGDTSGLPGSGDVVFERCVFAKNAGNGVLVRGGAMVTMRECDIASNGRFGCEFIDCEGALTSNAIRKNKRGGVSRTNGAEDMVDIDGSNVIEN